MKVEARNGLLRDFDEITSDGSGQISCRYQKAQSHCKLGR